MQPPRRRASRLNLKSPIILNSVMLNATAGISALLIVRLASLLVPESSDRFFAYYVQLLTQPLVWPFRQLPVLNSVLGRDVLLADVVVIPLVAIAGLIATGILAGWQEASSAPPYQDPTNV